MALIQAETLDEVALEAKFFLKRMEIKIAKLEAKERGEKYVPEQKIRSKLRDKPETESEAEEKEETPAAGRLSGVYSFVSGLF